MIAVPRGFELPVPVDAAQARLAAVAVGVAAVRAAW
jgi:hypothetical protein